jgi:mono/diheme cytochrome c family protein
VPPRPERFACSGRRPADVRHDQAALAEHLDLIRARALTLPLAAAALAVAGCDLIDRGDNIVRGKALFIDNCGACHALDRAGTGGTAGPDLDAAFRRARADGLGADTIAGIVEQQILHPGPSSRMPAALVTGDDAENVAAYVAHAAAVPGEDQGRLGGGGLKTVSRRTSGIRPLTAAASAPWSWAVLAG